MSTTKTDEALQTDVLDALRVNTSVRAAHIGVAATAGAVTLSGEVETIDERYTAVDVAQGVEGVRAVANEIHVRGFDGQNRNDTDIAVDISAALENFAPAAGHVNVDVVDRVVVLSGVVPLYADREAAESVAARVDGVANVVNHVSIGPPPAPGDVEQRILAAFVETATDRAGRVSVQLDDGHVLLKGNVASLAEKKLAERAAYEVRGVSGVKNHLHVHS
jgi:osmotically-inducible protein OsmY